MKFLRLRQALKFFSLSILIALNSFAQSNNPKVGSLLTLDSNLNMDIPFQVLIEVVGDNGQIQQQVYMLEDTYFQDGLKFAFTDKIALSGFGNQIDDSLMPLAFVNPLLPDGTVDTSTIYGVPSQFLKMEDGTVLYEHPRVLSFFDLKYKEAGSSFEAEQDRLTNYLNYISETQKASNYVSPKQAASESDGVESPLKLPKTPSEGQAADETANSETPQLSFGSLLTPKDDTVSLESDVNSAATDSAVKTVASGDESRGEVLPGSDSSSKPVPAVKAKINYHKDDRFNNLIEVQITSPIENVIVRNPKLATKNLNQSSFDLLAGSRFISVPSRLIVKTQIKGIDVKFRTMYQVDSKGNIRLDSNGEPIEFIIPQDVMEYYDPVSKSLKPVTSDTLLAQTNATLSANLSEAGKAAEEEPKSSPRVYDSGPRPRFVKSTEGKIDDASSSPASAAIDRAEVQGSAQCINKNYINQLSGQGQCQLVPIENFQLVKSRLIKELKADESGRTSALFRSSVIAFDPTTKMCSKIDLSQEEYFTNKKAQERILEYQTNMKKYYQEISLSFHKAGQRLGGAFPGEPQAGRFTYSCDRTGSQCRIGEDFYSPERIPFVQEIKNYSDDPLKKESIKVYGPTEDHKYLVIHKLGAQDTRAIVVKDNPGVILDGAIGNVVDEMDKFAKRYSFSSLMEIQDHFELAKLQETHQGYFLSYEMVNSSGVLISKKERLGTPEALKLVNEINYGAISRQDMSRRQKQSFYELKCQVNPLKKSSTLPRWLMDSVVE